MPILSRQDISENCPSILLAREDIRRDSESVEDLLVTGLSWCYCSYASPVSSSADISVVADRRVVPVTSYFLGSAYGIAT